MLFQIAWMHKRTCVCAWVMSWLTNFFFVRTLSSIIWYVYHIYSPLVFKYLLCFKLTNHAEHTVRLNHVIHNTNISYCHVVIIKSHNNKDYIFRSLKVCMSLVIAYLKTVDLNISITQTLKICCLLWADSLETLLPASFKRFVCF